MSGRSVLLLFVAGILPLFKFANGCSGSCLVNRIELVDSESRLSLLQQTSKVTRKSSAIHEGIIASDFKEARNSSRRERFRLNKKARLNEVLVVPSLKLIFCFIPKNACTQFNRLANALNGIDLLWNGEVCSDHDPNYKSGMYNNFTAELLEDALNDPSWTKATFLRDPLQRLVSAYLSKCVEPRECGGCEGLENSGSARPDILDLAQVLPYTKDAHFLPQSSLCGGLGENIGAYDYVGHISEDGASVSRQVAEMLELALKRQQPDFETSANARDTDPVGAESSQPMQIESPSETSSLGLVPEGSLSPFGRTLSERETHILGLGRKFFPPSGPDRNDPHVHGTQDTSGILKDMFVLEKVLSGYEKDYEDLPGLTRPAWAHRVSKFYDIFSLMHPRPKWLSVPTSEV